MFCIIKLRGVRPCIRLHEINKQTLIGTGKITFVEKQGIIISLDW